MTWAKDVSFLFPRALKELVQEFPVVGTEDFNF